jgi:peroxiredoxin
MPKHINKLLLAALLTLSQLAYSATLKPYPEGTATPKLILKDLSGKSHDLADYKGKVVLVQFWATYCIPCAKEMPTMNKLMKKMGDKHFKILAVDMGETKAEVEAFVAKVKPKFTILLDPSGETIQRWKVFVSPSNFIIGPSGKIRYTLFGGVEWDSQKMVDALKKLAAE